MELEPGEMDAYDFVFEYLKNRGEYDQLIPILEMGLKKNPDQIRINEYLIFAYLKTGKETLAISEMEKILEQKPDDMELWLQLARLSEKKNQIPKSIKAYRRVLDLYPEHPEASEAYLRLRLEGVGGD